MASAPLLVLYYTGVILLSFMALLVHQPPGGDARHPGADQRNPLSAEEQPVVSVPEGAHDKTPVHSATLPLFC